ncbi:MAG: hemolysin III family protein [Thermodesulfobacteriota bacterium]
MANPISRRYSNSEEVANSITHGIGALLAIAALGVLTAYSTLKGNAVHIVSCSIFGATLIFQYLSSTLYHSISQIRAKSILRMFDHIAIVLLIAGTYTPFALICLQGTWGWSIFGTIWGLALMGIIFEVTPLKKHRFALVSLYISMGWVIIIAIRPLFQSLDFRGFVLLVLGGLVYTLGVTFYVWKKLPYSHAIWHLFVLGGSTLHFFAILFYVIPSQA